MECSSYGLSSPAAQGVAMGASGFAGATKGIAFGSRQQLRRTRSSWPWHSRKGLVSCRSEATTAESSSHASSVRTELLNYGGDQLEVCRVINGMWQTSGGWGRIDPLKAVGAMLKHADAGFTTFDMADHYGPAEVLFGDFINKVRRERGDELASKIKGLTKWVPMPEKMTRAWVETNIDRSRKRMDVKTLDMLQFHWWDYGNSGYLDALKHMADLKEEGKIKTLALTNFDTKRLAIILEHGIPIVSNQVQHSLVDMRPQQQMSELCQMTGVKLITLVL